MDYYHAVLKNYISLEEMLMNVIGNSSNNSKNKTDTSFFVHKPYLRTSYTESNIKEGKDIKETLKN